MHGLSDKAHWIKGESERALFCEDQFALSGLPGKAFEVVRYIRPRADKYGKVHIDGCHLYSTDTSFAGSIVIAAIGATKISFYDIHGTFICEHERAYGSAPTDSSKPASQIALLCNKPGGWINSQVRAQISEELRSHMDSLGKTDLKAELRIMRDETANHGWDIAIKAMEASLKSIGKVDSASVSVAAARFSSGAIQYDEPVDLSVYDKACKQVRGTL